MPRRPSRCVLLLALLPQIASAQAIAPGRWDVRSTGVELVVPGAPAFMLRMMQGRSRTENTCVPPDAAATGMAALLVPRPAAKCTVERAVVANGRIDHVMLCPQTTGAPLRVARTGTYTAAGFAIRMTMAGTTPKGPLRIVADQVAAYAGPKCR